ncbi:MAG: VCBS repeat-containing protein [Pseudomonadota bacterium]
MRYRIIYSVFIVSVLYGGNAYALSPPSGPVTTNGTFDVTWSIPASGMTSLQERVAGGSWTVIEGPQNTSGRVALTRDPGRYEYRVSNFLAVWAPTDPEIVITYSAPIAVEVVPAITTPSVEQQALYEWQVYTGDINADGQSDLFLRRLSGDLMNGVLQEAIVLRGSDGKYRQMSPSPSQLATARSWPVSNAYTVPADYDGDGFVDIFIGTPDSTDEDVILFSTGFQNNTGAKLVVPFDDSSRMFFRDLTELLFDPNYFDQAVSPDRPGYNLRLDVRIQFCQNGTAGYWNIFPFCYDTTYTVVDMDFELPEMGLDGPINVQTKTSPTGYSLEQVADYIAPAVHAEASTFMSQHSIYSLRTVSEQNRNLALQEIGGFLPSINPQDSLQCQVFCVNVDVDQSSPGVVLRITWSETITPITIPGGDFDSENFSQDAFRFWEEQQTIGPIDPDATGPAAIPAAEALKRLFVVIAGVLTRQQPDTVEVPNEIEDENVPISGKAEAVLEAMIAGKCAELSQSSNPVYDAEECVMMAKDVAEAIQRGELVINWPGTVDIDPDELDEDYLAERWTVFAVALTRLKKPSRQNCTYTKTAPGPSPKVYSGRTSTTANRTCEDAINRRDAAHRLRSPWLAGFGKAVRDKSATGTLGYPAIRGREQQLMDYWGDRARSANAIRGVARSNPLGCFFHQTANSIFTTQLFPYTGIGSCLD